MKIDEQINPVNRSRAMRSVRQTETGLLTSELDIFTHSTICGLCTRCSDVIVLSIKPRTQPRWRYSYCKQRAS